MVVWTKWKKKKQFLWVKLCTTPYKNYILVLNPQYLRKWFYLKIGSLQVWISSITQSCLALCNPVDCSTPGLPVHHQLSEFTQTHAHLVGDAIQSSHPLSSPSPHTFNLSQHESLFKRVSSSHQVAKVLEFQLQHPSFQWIFKADFL